MLALRLHICPSCGGSSLPINIFTYWPQSLLEKRCQDLYNLNVCDTLYHLSIRTLMALIMIVSHDLLWLQELHERIWNRADLKPELFYSVEVTRTHYDALQASLKRKYPNRDLPTYNGSRNVLNSKLEILKSTTPADVGDGSSVDSEANEEDLDSEVNRCFPFKFNYLDMSSLKLKYIPLRFPLPLYIREEYNHISGLIRNSSESVVVSGQPGTGEDLVSMSCRI
jgi:hypothetical protein